VQSIRTKINVVIILLIAAIGVSAVIYTRGGFSITNNETVVYCGNTSFEPVITNNRGRTLYSANCASCHLITKELTGPALAGFEKHFPSALLHLFIQHPQKAYKKSKYLARLKQEYQVEHFAFPSLSKEDVNDIVEYIKEASVQAQ